MPRLRNTSTGVIVNVSDDLAASLDGYEPLGKSSTTGTKSGTPKKASDSDSSK